VDDPPAVYDAAFSVGATDSSDGIVSFSGRGPVTEDGSGRRKPDLSAPGRSVRSSTPGTGYGFSSGTSMAGPHVAGTAALLWSAAPSLIGDVDITERIIGRTARPRTTLQGCGGDAADEVPNNVYGWGIVDALAATPQTWAWVSVAGQAQVLEGFPVPGVRYTLTLTNVAPLSLTQVIISDTLPAGTTLTWAEGDYRVEGDTVRWEIPSLPRGAVLSRTLEVALSHPMHGERLTNVYQLHVDSLPVLPEEAEVDVTIPWRMLLFPILKERRLEGL
jgi:subtilisin family serine protease